MKNNSFYLLTGAAGFLGSLICKQLVQRGEKVRAFVLPNDKAAKYIPQGVEICEGDLLDKKAVERFFDVEEQYRIKVIHCASIVTVNPEFNQKVMDVNVQGTENIVEMCKAKPNFDKLVYVGSTGTLPETPMGTPIKEPKRYDATLVYDCYSQSKAIASQYVLDAASNGLNACVVMPTGIMGPEDFSVSTTTHTVIQIIKGEMPMGIDGSFNLVDVRDLADGVIRAMDKGRSNESYILGNDIIRFKDFAKIISQYSGCKRIKFFLPCRVASFMAGIAEKNAKKSGKKPLLTKFSVYNLARNNEFDSSKAKKELGYRTRPCSETLKDEVSWLKENNLI